MKKLTFVLTLILIILSNCEIKVTPKQVIAQPKASDNIDKNRTVHKEIIKYVDGDNIESTIQPWLNKGWRVKHISSENVSSGTNANFEYTGHMKGAFVIVLTSE